MVSLSFAEFNVDCKRDAEVFDDWVYSFMFMPVGVHGKNDEGDVLGESRYLLGSTLIFSLEVQVNFESCSDRAENWYTWVFGVGLSNPDHKIFTRAAKLGSVASQP